MSDNLEMFRALSRGKPAEAKGHTPADAPDEDEAACSAFGYLRGERDRALNLELRRQEEGDSMTFPYSWMGPCRYHPSRGILLLFAGSELYLVTIRGRNLNRLREKGVNLFERGILRHRVTWIREMSGEESQDIPREECVVERIECRAVTPEEATKLLAMV
jgi:hypothetical protein